MELQAKILIHKSHQSYTKQIPVVSTQRMGGQKIKKMMIMKKKKKDKICSEFKIIFS